jgi:cytochrome c biogenesis protein CcmG/thiol:disulfide interchange protein DsbE
LAKQKAALIIGLNYKDTREDALNWLGRLGNPYDVSVTDPEGRIGIDWGVYGVPETFVVDKKGIIRHKQTGPVTPKSVRQTLLPLIAKLQSE